MQSTPPIVDCHAHLADDRIWDDRAQWLARSRDKGLAALLPNAAQLHEWPRILDYARTFGIRGAIGIHPFWPEQWTDEARTQMLNILDSPITRPLVAAVGEIGLDAWNGKDRLPAQITACRAQLEIACHRGLPVCLHNRKAWQEFFAITKDLLPLRGYMHNFTASKEIARKLLDMGLLISFCSPLARPEARRLRELASYIPLDRILTETDCPDLPPPPFFGHFSEPWHASYPLHAVAEAHQIPIQDAAHAILENFNRALNT